MDGGAADVATAAARTQAEVNVPPLDLCALPAGAVPRPAQSLPGGGARKPTEHAVPDLTSLISPVS